MNLKDLDPKLFRESLSKFAAEAKDRFMRDVDERVEAIRKGVDDASKWNLPSEMSALFTQWFSKEATVFTSSIHNPTPGHVRYGDNEGTVYLKFGGYEFELGRMKNLDTLFDSKVILFVVPEKKETARE